MPRRYSYRGASHPAPKSRAKPVKYTPERTQQIKNMVERGKSLAEIAELIGVTVGSLQVTCSRLAISLRRPTFKGRLERNLQQEQMDEAEHLVPSYQVGMIANEGGAASFALQMQYRGEERSTELPLAQDTIRQLASEAASRNMSMGELIGEIIVAVLKRDLFANGPRV